MKKNITFLTLLLAVTFAEAQTVTMSLKDLKALKEELKNVNKRVSESGSNIKVAQERAAKAQREAIEAKAKADMAQRRNREQQEVIQSFSELKKSLDEMVKLKDTELLEQESENDRLKIQLEQLKILQQKDSIYYAQQVALKESQIKDLDKQGEIYDQASQYMNNVVFGETFKIMAFMKDGFLKNNINSGLEVDERNSKEIAPKYVLHLEVNYNDQYASQKQAPEYYYKIDYQAARGGNIKTLVSNRRIDGGRKVRQKLDMGGINLGDYTDGMFTFTMLYENDEQEVVKKRHQFSFRNLKLSSRE